MYNLSDQTFQIMSLITHDLWIVQIIALLEFVKRVVKAKIDFLISASKLEILFNTNICIMYICIVNYIYKQIHMEKTF